MKFIAYTHSNPLIHGSGGEKYLQFFLEELAKNNQCICICTQDYDLWKVKKTVNNVTYIHQTQGEPILQKYVNAIKPDYIITQFFNSPEAIKIAHNNNSKVIYLVHNDNLESTGRELMMLSSKDIAVFNTYWIANKMMTKSKRCVVHPMINTKEIKSSNEFITFINPIKIKGVNIFYRIAEIMKDDKFLVVKGGYGNQEIYELSNIKFIKNSQNVFRDIYSKTKILLCPSLYESYGMVAAEAASCGIPVVCSDSAGFRECLGDTGRYVNSFNAIDWVKQLNKLKDEKEYQLVSNATKNFIKNDISKKYINNLLNLL